MVIVRLFMLVNCATAALHHLYVGHTEDSILHALELDDNERRVTEMGMIPGSGPASSLVMDPSKKVLFSSNPEKGTLSRYGVQNDYSLKSEGSISIPASCNTTKFNTLHLVSSDQAPHSIFGSASTGTCSTIFSTPVTGSHSLRSREFVGDIRSLAWTPDGRYLHALDSHASPLTATSIFNFFIAENATLDDQRETDILANVTGAEQMVIHPSRNMVYVISKMNNQLITMRLGEQRAANSSRSPDRYNILPSTIDGSLYTTSSLAISRSNATLWALSQSNAQAIITVFSLDASTGEVIGAVARAAWSGLGAVGSGQIAPAPFVERDMIAVADSPVGMVAFLGLETTATATDKKVGKEMVNIDGDGFLNEIWTLAAGRNGATVKLKSYGRIDLGLDRLGECVWVD